MKAISVELCMQSWDGIVSGLLILYTYKIALIYENQSADLSYSVEMCLVVTKETG